MQIRFLTVGGWAAYASRIRLLVGVVLVALLQASASISAWAQDQQETLAPWLDITIVQVKAGHQGEFEDLMKKITAANIKAKRPPTGVYQVVAGSPGTYHILTGMQKLAENDNPPPPPMKPEEMANVVNRLLPTLAEGHILYARTFPQYQTQGDGDADAKLMLLRTVRVVAQRGDDFLKWVDNDLMPAMKKAKMGVTVSQGIFGDSPQNYYFASPVANWAALDQPDPLRESMGAKAYQQMLDKLKGVIESNELTLLRFRDDLSNPTD